MLEEIAQAINEAIKNAIPVKKIIHGFYKSMLKNNLIYHTYQEIEDSFPVRKTH